MNVLITGAQGYIGQALAHRLAGPGAKVSGRPVQSLLLCDLDLDAAQAPPAAQLLRGSLTDPAVVDAAVKTRPDLVFHLASVPSGLSERDHALGMAVNVQASLALLTALAGAGTAPVFVFASSIAVFGTPLPAHIDDHTPPSPSLSYGAQKQVMEILLQDATRRGQVRGRSVRLPGVVARPPTPTGALSAFSSALIRSLAAQRPYTCPVSPSATLWLLSLERCLDNLLHAAELDPATCGGRTVWTLPALRLSIAELVAAWVQRHPGAEGLVQYAPDAALEAQFGRLPPLHTPEAEAAGFRHDGHVDDLLARAVAALQT